MNQYVFNISGGHVTIEGTFFYEGGQRRKAEADQEETEVTAKRQRVSTPDLPLSGRSGVNVTPSQNPSEERDSDTSNATNFETKDRKASADGAPSGQHPRARNRTSDTASDGTPGPDCALDWRTIAIRTAAAIFEDKFVDLFTGLELSKTAAKSILGCVRICCESMESTSLQYLVEETGRRFTRKLLQLLAETVETALEDLDSFKRLARAARDGVIDAVCSAITYVNSIITKIYYK